MDNLATFPATSLIKKTIPTRQKKILILSDDVNYVNKFSFSFNKCGMDANYSVIATTQLSEAIAQAEENCFDMICVDYNTVGQNTLTFIEFITKTLAINSSTPKVVLTESFTHISNTERKNILHYACRVTCKTADYFDLRDIIREIAIQACN